MHSSKFIKVFVIAFLVNLNFCIAFSAHGNRETRKPNSTKAKLMTGFSSAKPQLLNGYYSIADLILTIEGQTYTDTNTGIWNGVTFDRSNPTSFTFRNNAISSVNDGNYMLLAGDEDIQSSNNNLDSELISGNKLTWGGASDADGCHGIFVGYNKNYSINYNYLNHVPYGIVTKSGAAGGENMTNTSGGISYNIIKNSYLGVRIKGMNGVMIYNNTFYDDMHQGLSGFIYSTTNPDNGNKPSTGIKIKNNIFYLKYAGNYIHIETGDESGFECDYNIYYCESGTPTWNYHGSAKTFAQWQALGYDLHSMIINPNFINRTALVPSIRLDYGVNLGSEFQNGLTTAAVWTVGTSPAIVSQTETWQVGARLYAAGKAVYLSPSGNDINLGTFDSPWNTLNKAMSRVAAGDTVFMRGGTYSYTVASSISGKNGTPSNLIHIINYPGEMPVIDGALDINISLITITNCSYLNFKGIRCTNLVQPLIPTSGYYGIILWSNVTHSTFELVETDHIGGWGIVIGDNCSDLLFLNCDSHHNMDPNSTQPYGGADGFETGSHGAGASTNITFRGCRSWSNSDDGWDLRQADGIFTLENCWSFWNGFIPGTWETGGDGDGYKLGGKTSPATNAILRTIKNSLSIKNRGTGITPEPDDANSILGTAVYNCVAYDNSSGWGNGINTGNYSNYTIVRNSIDYNNNGRGEWMQTGSVHDHNNFDVPITVSDADFLSVNSAGIDGPRQADGNLPKLDFLKLSSSSNLIDAGVDVGITYYGSAPDIGAFETGGPLTGISKLKNMSNGYLIYPNPVVNILLIEPQKNNENIYLSLFDESGKKLIEMTSKGNSSIDFSNYAPGIYFLRATSEGKTSINKIIKY
jgi:hypothetical protein